MLTVRVVDDAGDVIEDLPWVSATARHELMFDGGWEVVVAGSGRLLGVLQNRAERFWVMLVDHSTGHVHGGPLREVSAKRSREGGDDLTIKLSGGDANWLMNTTITLPSITQTNYPGSPARTSRTYLLSPSYQASTALRKLVDDQINVVNLVYRNINVFVNGFSPAGDTRASFGLNDNPFEPLMDTIRSWSLLGNVVTDFQFNPSPTTLPINTVGMQVRSPVSRSFVLSEEHGSLIDWEYTETADTLNYPWMGGAGTGVDRKVFPVANTIPAKWGTTIERFVNASSSGSDEAIIVAGKTAAFDNAAAVSMKARGVTAPLGIEFGADYGMGDELSVVYGGVEYRQLVTAVEIGWGVAGKTEELETGEPSFATSWQGVAVTPWPLGRVAPVTYPPSAGLALGYLKPVEQIQVSGSDTFVRLELELVYAPGDATVQDQSLWVLERRVDGGSWLVHDNTTPGDWISSGLGRALGTEDIFYGSATQTVVFPAYTNTLEYRGRLTKTGETTVYSSTWLVDVTAGNRAPFNLSATQNGNVTVGQYAFVAATASGSPAPTFSYVFQVDAVNVQTGGSQNYLIDAGDVGGVLTVDITATNTESPDATMTVTFGTVLASSAGAVFDINDTGDDLLIDDTGDDQLLIDE